MFENVFDITYVEEVVPDGQSVIQRAKRVLSEFDDRTCMAFLYGSGRRPMFVQYLHWSESGGRVLSGHHGVNATFVDLSLVTSVSRDGDDLVLYGESGFVRHCRTYHSDYYHDAEGDPFEDDGESVETRRTSVRFEGVCEGYGPSPYDVISEFVSKGDGRDVTGDEETPSASGTERMAECDMTTGWRE